MVDQTLHWAEVVTAFILVATLVSLISVGLTLRWLVTSKALLASTALTIIGSISKVVGGLLGSVGILVVLVILFPTAAEWIVNTYMPRTIIWQTNFQTWLTQQVTDSRTATAMGLILKSFSLGSALLGFVFGQFSQAFFSTVLGKSFHYRMHTEQVALSLNRDGVAHEKRLAQVEIVQRQGTTPPPPKGPR